MAENNKVGVGCNGNCKSEIVKRLLVAFKNLNKAIRYLTSNTKKVFTQLKQALAKTLSFRHFNLEYYIGIEINALNYTIRDMLGQLADMGQ